MFQQPNARKVAVTVKLILSALVPVLVLELPDYENKNDCIPQILSILGQFV